MEQERERAHYSFEVSQRSNNDIDGLPSFVTRRADVEFSDMTSWPNVLHEFAKFLGSHYGYDILNDIRVKGVVLADVPFGYAYIKPVNEGKKKKTGTE